MSGAVVRTIISGQNYPVSFFQNVLLRIKADSEVIYERAAIIKAYFTKNRRKEILMEIN